MRPSFVFNFSLLACVLSFFNGVIASNVIELTPKNFDEIVGAGKPALVEFFAPWCGHCKTLAPVFEQLADSYQYAKDKVVVAKVDADAHRDLGKRFGIQGFPTLKWFNGKAENPEDYRSGRDLESLSGFIEEKAGIRARAKKAEPPMVVALTDATFNQTVLDANKDVFVKFYAPWCGHCKTLAPIWEKLAKDFEYEKDVVIAKIDAEANPVVAEVYGITSYPQLKWFAKGSSKKEPVDYSQGRSELDLLRYVNSQAGTHRLEGGGLDEEIGHIKDLDELAKKLAMASNDAEEGYVYDELPLVLERTISPHTKYYSKIFEKLRSNPQYAVNEKSRLEAILAKGAVTSDKLDDFRIRLNILSSFGVSQKHGKHEEL